MGEEKNYWMINVNVKKYNLFGAVREFGKALPWEVPADSGVRENDVVYFYLLGSEEDKTDTSLSDGMIEKTFKRIVFSGEITEVKEESDTRAEKYWTDKGNKECGQQYVTIKIKEFTYLKNIRSKDLKDLQWSEKPIWNLGSDAVNMIENMLNS